MEIIQKRFTSDADTSISNVFIDDKWICFFIEDGFREEKIAGETRIPAGKYNIHVRDYGGFHQRYKRIFSFHEGMLELADVPGFQYILIHCGNTDSDTEGCLLPNYGAHCEPDNIYGLSSRKAYEIFYRKVIDSAKNGILTIIIIDEDI